MWPATVRTVRRDVPAIGMGHNSVGRFSKKKAVTRLFVFHVVTTAPARSTAAMCTKVVRDFSVLFALAISLAFTNVVFRPA